MAATAQMVKPQEKAGTWSTIFPTEQVTEQQSALFVKKLLAVAVSNITYLRAIFPENAFGDRCLEDLNLKILRDDSACPGACQVIKWVKGCFDALDKKYLKMLIIGIYTDPDDPDTVIEAYTFKFSYSEDGGVDIYRNNKKVSSAHSAAETKKATIRLLRTIVVLTQSLSSLPDDVMMTMKLLYYDEVTPTDYEPPGFTAAENDAFTFEEEPMNIKVGDVNTPFHTVKLRIKTDAKQFEVQDDSMMDTQTTVDEAASQAAEEANTKDVNLTETLDLDLDKGDTEEMEESVSRSKSRKNRKRKQGGEQDVVEPTVADDAPGDTPVKPGAHERANDTTGSQVVSNTGSQQSEDLGVRCPCGCNEDDGLMILCANCKFWQHGVCFKILNEDEAPERHICDLCDDPIDPELKATDSQLRGLNEIAVQAMCLWRRALQACTDIGRVLCPSFAKRLGVETTVAQGLINRLEKEGFLKAPAKGKRLGKVVNKEALLKDGFKKYFKKDDDSKENEETSKSPSEGQMKEVLIEVEDKGTSGDNQNTDKEIEKLATKTENLSVSGQRKRKIKENLQPIAIDQLQPSPESVEVESTNNKKRGQKRVKAKVDEEMEFELENSQEVSNERSSKRHKASKVRKPIMV